MIFQRFVFASPLLIVPLVAAATADDLEDQLYAGTMGQATTAPDRVVGIVRPRNDVPLTFDGMPWRRFADLVYRAASNRDPHVAMVTIDILDEATPSTHASFVHGPEVSGLHIDISHDEPKVQAMCIRGLRKPVKIAKGFRLALHAPTEVAGQAIRQR